MSDDTYFFEVSVAEHPQTKKRMNDLAKTVINAQSEMTKAVTMVGSAADASTKNLDKMLGLFGGFSKDAQVSIKAVQEEIKALQELSRQKITQVVEVVHQGAGGMPTDALGPGMPSAPSAPSAPSQNWPDPQEQVDDLHDAMVKEKAIFEEKVQNQKVAFEKAAADYDKAVEMQGRSSEEMNKAALKGARGLIDAAKGWTQLGLVGEENSKKLLESLVLVEGAFNIAKGGIEFLEAFGQGWKAIKSGQDAANNVSKITAALRSAEFAQLRAYHIALVQEAQAASVAAGANGRLAASRAAASGAAGKGAVAAMTGTATKVGTSAVGAAATAAGGAPAAAAAWNTIGGVAVSGAATIGIFAAAVAGAGFGLRALYDVVTGTGKQVGSFNDTIATWEVETASAIAGLFGFTTELAAGRKRVEEAEKRSLKLRAEVDKKYADENTRRDANNATTRASFETRNKIRSIDAGDDKEMQLAAASEKRLSATKLLAEYTEKMVDLQSKNLQGTEDYKDTEQQVIQYRKDELDAITEQGKLEADVAKSAIDNHKEEKKAIEDKMKEAKKGLEDLEKSQQSAVENFAKLDKVQQVTAIKALDKARASGGASLSDKEKDLLRSVGTDEAKRLASEGDKAEANAVGFNRTFGSGFEAERQAMDATQKKLEAEFKTNYEVIVKTENNLDEIQDKLKDAARNAVVEENAKANEVIIRAMNEGLAKNNQVMIQTINQKFKTNNRG
jgi:hypothetical protein